MADEDDLVLSNQIALINKDRLTLQALRIDLKHMYILLEPISMHTHSGAERVIRITMADLSDEGRCGRAFVLPVRRQHTLGLVVSGQSVDSRFDQD